MKRKCILFLVIFSQISYGKNFNEIILNDVDIVAYDKNITKSYENKYGGKVTFSKYYIDSLATQNGDIASFLRIHPNVSLNSYAKSSNNVGEINLQDVSINGGLYYQNNFIIDGISANNDINPDSIKKFNDNHTKPFGLLDNKSQGLNLDIDLVESIDVYDSYIPAKYGNFTSGVIKVNTKNPTKKFGGKVSIAHTRDSWTKFHQDENQKRISENGAVIPHQDKFKKTIYRTNFEGHINENFGMLFGYSKVLSKIPTNDYDEKFINKKYGKNIEKYLKKELDNLFLKGIWYINDTYILIPTFVYSVQKDDNYLAHSINSYSKQKSDDYSIGFALEADYDKFDAKYNFSFSNMKLKRDSVNNYFLSWFGDNVKNWGVGNYNLAYEGAYGDIEQTQRNFEYNFDILTKEFQILDTKHKVNFGAKYSYKNAKFNAKEDMYLFGVSDFTDFMLDSNLKCKTGDKLCSDKGIIPQYFKEGNYYKKGSVDAGMNSLSLYLDDEINYNHITFRPGLRYDWDDYMKKHTIAPRVAGYYDVFNDEKLILSAGLNRYYGRNSFSYKLNSAIFDKLEEKMTRESPKDEWIYTKENINPYANFKKLNMPYDDELAFGLGYKFSNFDLRVKYVNRKGRDQIISHKDENRKIYYTNDGKSNSDIYTFSLKNLNSYEIFNIINNFEIAFDYMQTKRNIESSRYDGLLGDRNSNAFIKYNKKIIKYKDKPSELFNDKWTLRLITNSKIPNLNLTISNFFSLKAPYEMQELTDETFTYEGKEIPVIETKRHSCRFNWDLRVNYKKELAKNSEFFVNLDLLNVLNEKNIIGFNDGGHQNINQITSYDVSENIYGNARQVWLEVGVRF